MFASEFRYIARAHTMRGLLVREYVLSAILCSLIGYLVFWKWRSTPGLWVWLAGVALFVYRAILLWMAPHPLFLSVLADRPNLAAVARRMFEPPYVINTTVFAVMLIRTIFYSAGAWVRQSQDRFGRLTPASKSPTAVAFPEP